MSRSPVENPPAETVEDVRILWRQWAMNTAVNAAVISRSGLTVDDLLLDAEKIFDWVKK